MSVKNSNKSLCIQNLTTGEVVTIKNYFDFSEKLQRDSLFFYLDLVMRNTENIKIYVTYNNNNNDI